MLVSVDGLGPVGFGALLRRFGSGLGILETALRPGAVRRLVAAGVTDERATFDADVAEGIVAVAEQPATALRRVEVPGVEILTTEDAAYPARLLAIEMPPHVLFVRGSVDGAVERPRRGRRRDAPADRVWSGDRGTHRWRARQRGRNRRVRARRRDRRREPRRRDR